jgi:hypothetical protein
MAPFAPQDPEFEASVRDSFTSLTLMKTVGTCLLRVSPGEVEIDLPFRADLTHTELRRREGARPRRLSLSNSASNTGTALALAYT